MSYLATTVENIAGLPGRITYSPVTGLYFYVLGVFGDSVLGVKVTGTGDGYTTENITVPLSDVEGQWSYALGDFAEWVAPLERHFQQGTTAGQNGASEGLSESDVESRIRSAVRERELALRAEFDRWKEDVTERAHEYADDNDLCGVFDQFMESVGLRPRTREWEVEVSISYNTTILVEARNEDDAAERVSDDVWSYLSTSDVRYDADVDINDVSPAS